MVLLMSLYSDATLRVEALRERRRRDNRVVSAETVNTFKNRSDEFWSGQEVLYDYKTDLQGIGNCSIV